MGYTPFPLTPALSPRERENDAQPLDLTHAGVCPTTTGKTPIRRLLFPAHEAYSQVVGNERMLENRFMGARRDQSSGRSLPEGEGQGEGEMLGRTRKVERNPRTPPCSAATLLEHTLEPGRGR